MWSGCKLYLILEISYKMNKNIHFLHAKGILLFLPWEVVLCTPMKKRKELMTAHNNCGSIDLFFNNPCSSGISKAQRKTGTVKEMSTKNDVTIAEIMWCLKVHYNSSRDLANLFQCMFADSEIARQFSLGKTKCRCLILYRIAPYCKSELLNQIS